jgi:hypothetical protein
VPDLTINMLASELGVSRRTIERALETGDLAPTYRMPSGRARFSRELVDTLKARADEAKRGGYKYVMTPALSPEAPLVLSRKRKPPPISPQLRARRTLWKLMHRPLSRRKAPGEPPARQVPAPVPEAVPAVSTLPADPHELPDALAAQAAARKARTAAAIKSGRLLGLRIRGLAGRPASRERAIAMLRAIENIARREPGPAAEHIRKTAGELGRTLKRDDPGKQDLRKLKGLMAYAVQLEREPYHFLAAALPNLLAWYECKSP